jgi:RHS repeat-associated protein
MANTKGTSVISTPEGGGAMGGIGEKFSPDLFTGTGNFSIPIAVPPGRNGMQPSLTLQYSSGSSNDVFGTGWNIGLPGVTRKTSKGIPVYNDKLDIFILTSPEDMVPVKIENTMDGSISWQKTYYRPRTEGLFARIIRHKKSNGEHYWEVRSKDGMISYYGTPGVAAENDTCVIADPEDRDKIYAWFMSRTVDPFENEMIYTYERDLVLSDERNYDNLYLKEINYCQYPDGLETNYLCKVVFNYEDRPDPFSGYKQGFEVRTTKRCTSIETWTNAASLIKTKTYHFDYADTIEGATIPLNKMSLLQRLRVEGHNGDESESMPPLEMKYSIFDPQKRELKEIAGPLPGASLAAGGFELVDLDGNGIPDILQLDGITARRWPNQGFGKFGTPLTIDVNPSLNLSDPGVQLIDADGDGKTDLLVNNGITAGFYSGNFKTVWDKKRFKPYAKIPSFSFADPEVKFIDLDGNGVTDVLRNGTSFECFFNDPKKGFYKTKFTNKKFTGGFPDFSFTNPRVRFADMTGDGMEDIVYINSGRVEYWPNLGYGKFGKRVVMKNCPRFPDEYDPGQVLLGDLDGDGITDLVFVENNQVTLYVSQCGNSFSDGQVIKGTPRVLNTQALRITDILGAGQSGILWSYGAGENIHGQMFFLDFTAGNKPYLLEEMNNNMGSLTRVKYGSSVYHYLRDQKNPATRWKTDLPFPVLVVNRVEMLDLLSGGKLSTEYLYHHGYWDGEEREFRGFARVDQKDTEVFEQFNTETLFTDHDFNAISAEHYSPPTETRNWFYPGPVGEGYGQWISPNFSEEYWGGDSFEFPQPADLTSLLSSLPRRAQRDALRTLRGTLLHSELYALDNSPLQNRPYTITGTQMSVRKEFDPSQSPDPNWITEHGYATGAGYVFFPFGTAQRTTQWERGNDPMHGFSFTTGYDAYGQATQQLSCGLSRGMVPQNGGGDYLGTTGITEFIYVDTPAQYMVTRGKRSLSYDATQLGSALNISLYAQDIFTNYASLPLLGCSITYYDGDEFTGLDFGEIGLYGVAVRSEALVLTEDILDEAYGGIPPALQTGTPSWGAEYPSDFTTYYDTNSPMGGYQFHTAGGEFPVEGWYAPGNAMKFDFQVTTPFFGLVLETKDPFDNVSSIEYDDYFLLPVLATDPLGLTMQADYDYRVMQAYQITDPNNNKSEFDFSPLGLLRAVAVIGKGTEGDYKSSSGTFYEKYEPSKRLGYDFFAFVNSGDPVWVKTTVREAHYAEDPGNDKTIVSCQYSDGFGRLLQTRSQAEDVIFGPSIGSGQIFGSSGLPASQTATNGPAVGVERDPMDPLNVTVSGWQVYNNKGAVVEKYEPFFSSGFDYELPTPIGVKIKMFYDPRGQVIRTVNPDHSEQWVIFGIPQALDAPQIFTPTPWENYVYDPNDLAPITNPSNTTVNPDHYYTPASSLVDGLGRVIKATNHHSFYNGSSWEDVVVNSVYDIRGNVLQVYDPLGRVLVETVYNMGSSPLKTTHLDAGIKTNITDCAGRAVESRDAKGALVLGIYDEGSRPTFAWARDLSTEDVTLRGYTGYGDNSGLTDPEDDNLKGKVYEQYDEAGYSKMPLYDFKGNILTNLRQFISDAELLSIFTPPPTNWEVECYRVDWTGVPSSPPAILDARVFETNSEYDALNRVTQVTYPEDTDSERKIGIPTYNRAGALESMEFDGDTYVNHIAYNAKGQRLLIAYGNTIMTRYVYDNLTFRLQRLKTEKYTQTDWEFAPNAGPRQDYAYSYDLVGNIVIMNDQSPDCGVGGSSELEKAFNYDPLYRLLQANGRENYPTTDFPWWDDSYRSEAVNDTTEYTQNYLYDKVGNMQTLQHLAHTSPHNFTRTFDYSATNNQLTGITVGGNTYSYSYDDVGNQVQENTNRHFEYDHSNNMRCFFNQAGTSEPTIYALYLYSGGQRVKKLVRTSGGGYESTLYIGGAYEYKTDGTDEQNLLHVEGVARVRTGDAMGDISPAIKYNLDDPLGSSMTLLDDTGNFVNREEYYPFGETSFGSYALKRYRFQGKEKDTESGLYYFGARYYCAVSCRFISVDVVLQPGQSSYCGFDNNPITKIDLDGNASIDGGNTTGSLGHTHVDVRNVQSRSSATKAGGIDRHLTAIDGPISTHTFSGGKQEATNISTTNTQQKAIREKSSPVEMSNSQPDLSTIANAYIGDPIKPTEEQLAASRGTLSVGKDPGGLYGVVRNIDSYMGSRTSGGGKAANWLYENIARSTASGVWTLGWKTLGGDKTRIRDLNGDWQKASEIEENTISGIADVGTAMFGAIGKTAGIGGKGVGSLDNGFKATKPYTKSNVKLGQEMHKAYKVGENGRKEFRLASGKRIDFLDLINGIIYELKPNNPRAVKMGEKQLKNYLEELASPENLKKYPELEQIIKSTNWKLVLDLY